MQTATEKFKAKGKLYGGVEKRGTHKTTFIFDEPAINGLTDSPGKSSSRHAVGCRVSYTLVIPQVLKIDNKAKYY